MTMRESNDEICHGHWLLVYTGTKFKIVYKV